MKESIPMLYRGSVKDVLGPIEVEGESCLIFEYSDAYSVFDWGRMPDLLPNKGESLAVLAADWFEKLENPENWVEFSRAPAALELRKANRFGSAFNELGEELQKKGLRTHYRGSWVDRKRVQLKNLEKPSQRILVRQVAVEKPKYVTVLGRSLPDYTKTRATGFPKLIPLEVIFRFSCPSGSSLIERTQENPNYMASIGFPEYTVQGGEKWEFPVLEVFTKLETSDRPLPLGEALAISGLTGEQLQECLFKTAWIAGFLKWNCARAGLELADGKLEWGLSQDGHCFLVDAIGPDELRLLRNGVQLSKEFLRTYYRKTPWYQATRDAKKKAETEGVAEWKRLVAEGPPVLPKRERELASQLYPSLANQLTGKNWFPGTWSLEKVITELSCSI